MSAGVQRPSRRHRHDARQKFGRNVNLANAAFCDRGVTCHRERHHHIDLVRLFFLGDAPTARRLQRNRAADGLDVLLAQTACPCDFDFLSIDVDGVDIHIWRAVEQYRPKLICIEFNPTIPTEVVFAQPADPRIKWGSSLAALTQLAAEKGYELICANDLNAFFVTAERFSLFGLEDNSPAALRPGDACRTFVFAGYDGTLLLSGTVPIPWHGFEISAEDIQPIPALLRKYPLEYNATQRLGARGFRLLRRARKALNARRRKRETSMQPLAAVNSSRSS
jgi:hypothetical protein